MIAWLKAWLRPKRKTPMSFEDVVFDTIRCDHRSRAVYNTPFGTCEMSWDKTGFHMTGPEWALEWWEMSAREKEGE